CQNDHSYPYTF
nr:immunoglobulin light chain junction region [Mus musculus]NSL97336.1 immunoglobulin light chain junction region [Mus musculus]NSL97488.1 immunoglobulin light chain junction region [Mus musculus]NSL97580.1 immunoglobulin light chain junction region [Mus musculus]NSL97695.1 immunoglobulin light chain junction region [Mus musculus]